MKVLVCSLTMMAAVSLAESSLIPLEVNIIDQEQVLLDTPYWVSPRPDSLVKPFSGGALIYTSGELRGNCTELRRESWVIGCGTMGEIILVERVLPEDGDYLVFDTIGDEWEQWIVMLHAEGDTVWKCGLEGTDEYDNYMEAVPLKDGGYLVISQPDCWSTDTYLARVSSGGELLWHEYLSTNYLLDMPEDRGEIYPNVNSVREKSDGDLLLCGRAQEWVTSPDAMYVCLIDGSTGQPLWKTTSYLLGEATAHDLVETPSGMILAVGATAESTSPEGSSNVSIWSDDHLPMVAVVSPDGELLAATPCDDTGVSSFRGVIGLNPAENEFIVFGSTGEQDRFDLLRIEVEVQQ